MQYFIQIIYCLPHHEREHTKRWLSTSRMQFLKWNNIKLIPYDGRDSGIICASPFSYKVGRGEIPAIEGSGQSSVSAAQASGAVRMRRFGRERYRSYMQMNAFSQEPFDFHNANIVSNCCSLQSRLHETKPNLCFCILSHSDSSVNCLLNTIVAHRRSDTINLFMSRSSDFDACSVFT